MKVRLNMTAEQQLEFEQWLMEWRAPKDKWVKRVDGIYAGELAEMKFEDDWLQLCGFRVEEDGPWGNNFFNPKGRVIFAGIKTKDGWQQIYSSCLHHQPRKEEIDFWTFGHSARQIKYRYFCSCGAEWTEWEWA